MCGALAAPLAASWYRTRAKKAAKTSFPLFHHFWPSHQLPTTQLSFASEPHTIPSATPCFVCCTCTSFIYLPSNFFKCIRIYWQRSGRQMFTAAMAMFHPQLCTTWLLPNWHWLPDPVLIITIWEQSSIPAVQVLHTHHKQRGPPSFVLPRSRLSHPWI